LKPFLALIVALVLGPYRRCSKDKFSPARYPATVAPCQGLQCAHWRRRKCSLQSRSEPHCKPRVGSASAINASPSGNRASIHAGINVRTRLKDVQVVVMGRER
jgi:hypothetical protein